MNEKGVILFATDLASSSYLAESYARWLALEWELELHVLHVNLMHDMVADLTKAEVSARFDELRERDVGSECSRFVSVRGVIPAAVIRGYCRQCSVKLIVMGTHAYSGLSRWLHGSVSEDVTAHAEPSVLLVPLDWDPSRIPPRRILVPMDFSRGAFESLKWVLELMLKSAVDIHLLAVDDGGSWSVDSMRSGLERIKGLLSENPIRTHIELGPVEPTLRRGVERFDIDLMVLALGRHGDDLGHLAKSILRHLACPTLVMRHTDADLDMADWGRFLSQQSY